MSGTDARFEHLSSQQRNEIFHAIHNLFQSWEHGKMNGITYDRKLSRLVKKLSRKFGVREGVIRSAFGHVYRKSLSR